MSKAVAPARGRVTLREAEPGDAAACAQIVFDAFGAIDDHYRFARGFPALEVASALIDALIPHPMVWGVVAEVDRRVVGANFLDERSSIRGVGPITVAPGEQNAGVGRELMHAVLERATGATGVRLLQDAFHMRSLYLYESLGFDVKEPLAVVTGKPASGAVPSVEVRRLEERDLDECAALCSQVHGYERTNELREVMQAFAPMAAVRDGRIVAYAATVTSWQMNHGVAEREEDMQALLRGAAAAVESPLAFLVPLRSGLFRWCVEERLRLVKPMNLMALGEYREPRGGWFPSAVY